MWNRSYSFIGWGNLNFDEGGANLIRGGEFLCGRRMLNSVGAGSGVIVRLSQSRTWDWRVCIKVQFYVKLRHSRILEGP